MNSCMWVTHKKRRASFEDFFKSIITGVTSCVLFPQEGKGSLGAAEWCVTCTEAALLIKGIWRNGASQVELLGVSRGYSKTCFGDNFWSRGRKSNQTSWYSLAFSHIKSSILVSHRADVCCQQWCFLPGDLSGRQVLGSSNIGTTANKSQNRILFPHSLCSTQPRRAGEKQHLSTTLFITYLISHGEKK